MHCRHCGHRNDPGATYCSSCGAPVADGADETTLRLGAVESREAVEAEFGARLAAIPAGTGVLAVRRGPNRGSLIRLDQPVTSLGRHPASDVFLDDVTVSRRHAEVRRTAAGYELTDVGSLNGTYVDHGRVDAARLTDGNEIQVGRFVLTFLLGTGPDDGGAT